MKNKHIKTTLATVCTLAIAGTASAVPIFFGPTAYLSSADIPAGLYAGGPTVLENFEDGSLDASITASGGSVIPPGFAGSIDSVDGDDGAIDGSGLGGHSWFGPTSMRFTFPVGTTAAGLVWTDGSDSLNFYAYGPGGGLLGSIGPVSTADGTFGGTTAEDRFFGVADAGGIESILITCGGGGMEVDHVQYGRAATTSVPDGSSSAALLLLGISSLAVLRRYGLGIAAC